MHIKRIPSPKNWPISRKENTWTARPLPGPHGLHKCITVNIILKEILKIAETTKEVKKILQDGKLFINKIKRNEYKFPVGIMDIIEVPDLKIQNIVLYNKNGDFILKEIKDSKTKLCKVTGKTVVKNKKIQIHLHDGRNKLLDKNAYTVGDTIVLDLEKGDIKDTLKLEKGAVIYLTDGSYVGNVGKVDKIENGTFDKKAKIIFTIGTKKYETLKDYAFVIGKEKPVIDI
ncbi:MAG: 30S ribosomal protein S4e [Candidatus Nanoarchaeia archaeon]|nr:30S ribosomal protein S4e [Candidatus Nanoarchaeia archaeon]MDD5587725.1 30S ribosomal protein S4e [Candidatus Nanoarchaeia archaeon]